MSNLTVEFLRKASSCLTLSGGYQLEYHQQRRVSVRVQSRAKGTRQGIILKYHARERQGQGTTPQYHTRESERERAEARVPLQSTTPERERPGYHTTVLHQKEKAEARVRGTTSQYHTRERELRPVYHITVPHQKE